MVARGSDCMETQEIANSIFLFLMFFPDPLLSFFLNKAYLKIRWIKPPYFSFII
jgi:hypothetical protein